MLALRGPSNEGNASWASRYSRNRRTGRPVRWSIARGTAHAVRCLHATAQSLWSSLSYHRVPTDSAVDSDSPRIRALPTRSGPWASRYFRNRPFRRNDGNEPDQAPTGTVSSIYMWAYGVEICFPPPAQKQFYSVHPHIVPKGRGHGFNSSIYS